MNRNINGSHDQDTDGLKDPMINTVTNWKHIQVIKDKLITIKKNYKIKLEITQ